MKFYILDRGENCCGAEFSGYDKNGHKIQGQEQIVRIIDKEGNTLAEYKGEDIENAMLTGLYNETDRYSISLLDVQTALTDGGVSERIPHWQAVKRTGYLVENGSSYKPENFVRTVKVEDI